MASIHSQKNPHNAALPGAASRWARYLPLGALILVAGLVSGCASIFGTETETLPITSRPPDAQILITDEAGYTVFRGRTPDRVPLPKSDGRYFGGKTFSIAISKKGYVTQQVQINTQPNALYLGGNILAGGVFGWLAVDPTNGKMYELSKAGVDVTLQKLPETASATTPEPAATSPATLPAANSSSTTDLRPPAAATAAAELSAAPLVVAPLAAPVTAAPAASAIPPPATPATAAPPSIFVPERPPASPAVAPPVSAQADPAPELLSPLPPEGAAPPAAPAPAGSRPPPPYWPAPPKLPVSPST